MRREHVSLWSPAMETSGDLIAYGDFGRPLLVFPSEAGSATDYESRGMIDVAAPLIESGRVKVYCVDSFDEATWSDRSLPIGARARRHAAYEDWILHQVVPAIHRDCNGTVDIMVTGPSFGAYHAVNFALKRADLFPLALCHSGVYDIANLPWAWGEGSEEVYFNNPMDYVRGLDGPHLDWLRDRVTIVITVGQGQWEDSTGALASSRQLAAVLNEKGIRHELDVWGHDVAHDWPWWRRQLAHHLPRFC